MQLRRGRSTVQFHIIIGRIKTNTDLRLPIVGSALK